MNRYSTSVALVCLVLSTTLLSCGSEPEIELREGQNDLDGVAELRKRQLVRFRQAGDTTIQELKTTDFIRDYVYYGHCARETDLNERGNTTTWEVYGQDTCALNDITGCRRVNCQLEPETSPHFRP